MYLGLLVEGCGGVTCGGVAGEGLARIYYYYVDRHSLIIIIIRQEFVYNEKLPYLPIIAFVF